ncbi:MAG: hypothetical protein N4A74_05200 [Carboxylicivirga sp.]|jgi:predicted transcriptional regulator|nr:hypothetical protein [Carboxylicivirga sp.]
MSSKKRRKQLSKAVYEKLKRTAYEYVVVQGMSQKEVAVILDVTEATMSNWAKEAKWKEERENRQQCMSTDADNLKKLLRVMSQQRLELEESILDAQKIGDTKEEIRLRKEARALSDEMSKQNKTLLSLDKSTYTLGTYIDVMDEIFNALRVYNEDLWAKTVDFQSTHVRKKTIEIG